MMTKSGFSFFDQYSGFRDTLMWTPWAWSFQRKVYNFRRILLLSQSNYVDKFYIFGILDRASETLDFTGFLSPEFSESV